MSPSDRPGRDPAAPEACPTVRTTSVAEWAESRLRRNGYLALRNISCEHHEGVLTLWGRLPTYYLKQVAQEAVADIQGVRRIDNRIEVLAPGVKPAGPDAPPAPDRS